METIDIQSMIRPVPRNGGFAMDGWWVWCGSSILGEDGRYHMFAARWPKSLPFFNGYIAASEIVRASSDGPEGPYRFEEVVLGDRGEEFWDGRMTHNPTIHKHNGRYYLFYIGATYKGARPDAELLNTPGPDSPARKFSGAAYSTIRIGCAVSDSVFGPWKRSDKPVLEPRPGKWDSSVVTNPAPCFTSDGRILLYYRSNTPGGLRIGCAVSDADKLEFTRFSDSPVFGADGSINVEDPYVWQQDGHFELIAKDLDGSACGEKWGGVHLISPDGLSWSFAPARKAYSRTLAFDDGSVRELYHLERPQLIFREGRPAYICAACGFDGGEGRGELKSSFSEMSDSRNIIIPLM